MPRSLKTRNHKDHSHQAKQAFEKEDEAIRRTAEKIAPGSDGLVPDRYTCRVPDLDSICCDVGIPDASLRSAAAAPGREKRLPQQPQIIP